MRGNSWKRDKSLNLVTHGAFELQGVAIEDHAGADHQWVAFDHSSRVGCDS